MAYSFSCLQYNRWTSGVEHRPNTATNAPGDGVLVKNCLLSEGPFSIESQQVSWAAFENEGTQMEPDAHTQSARRRGVSRRWCVPPAMLRDPADTLEGQRVLTESPGELAFLLWRTVQDVTLWAGSKPKQRGGLFTAGSGDERLSLLTAVAVPWKISSAVNTLHGMLMIGGRADAGVVTHCCLEVASWADGEGLPHTAIAFAQAGALTSPDLAGPASHVGIYARVAGQEARAGTWLRRALGLARKRDWAVYAATLVELGRLEEGRGAVPAAESFYLRAFRCGKRFAVRGVRMEAAHGLVRLAVARSDDPSAEHFALRAQSAYAEGAPGGPALLLYLARFWTDRGQAARARPALRRLWPFMDSLPPSSRLHALALGARVHPERARRKRAALVRAAWELLADDRIADDARCNAAIDLAHAARSAGDLVAFDRAKRMALRVAPGARFPSVVRMLGEVWPEGRTPGREAPALDRRS